MAEREPPTKVKRVNMTPASAEETKLKFRNYTPRDPELKKFILKKDSSEDSLLIKKQYLDRFVTLSTGSSVRAHCCLVLALAHSHRRRKPSRWPRRSPTGTSSATWRAD